MTGTLFSSAYLQGMGIGGGLIIAIGAQNAFVLAQGIRRQYHWLISLICSISDCLLIFIGTAGLGRLIASDPMLTRIAGWGGAAFLFVYGFKSFLSLFRSQSLAQADTRRSTLKAVVLTTLALTFLNPHVYLDTVVLLGSIAGQLPVSDRTLFTLGACTASVSWFFLLSFAGTRLAPLFKRQAVWKVLDGGICLVMWSIAISICPGF